MFTFYGYSKNSGLRNYGVKYIDGSSGRGRTDEGGDLWKKDEREDFWRGVEAFGRWAFGRIWGREGLRENFL